MGAIRGLEHFQTKGFGVHGNLVWGAIRGSIFKQKFTAFMEI
jgi:hypothetical protein